MGCSESQENDSPLGNIEKTFNELGLASLMEGAQFAEAAEEKIFMALNVCRFRPAMFIPIVNYVRNSHELAQKTKHTKELIKQLKALEELPPLRFDMKANQACLQNNQATVALDEKVPAWGGNILVYTNMVGTGVECEEYTMCKWESSVAAEFVALQLILDYNQFYKANIDDGNMIASPILKPECTNVGISLLAHEKAINLF